MNFRPFLAGFQHFLEVLLSSLAIPDYLDLHTILPLLLSKSGGRSETAPQARDSEIYPRCRYP